MSTHLVIGLLLAAAAICFVLAPLVVPRAFETGAEQSVPEAVCDPLERLRDDLFAQIVALDFEHATGKTDEEEYQHDRAALKRRALAVLRTLDERATDTTDAHEAAIEQAITIARARRVPLTVPDTDDDDPALLELDDEVERQVSALRQMRHIPAAPRE